MTGSIVLQNTREIFDSSNKILDLQNIKNLVKSIGTKPIGFTKVTILMYVAQCSDIQSIEFIIGEGADIKAVDKNKVAVLTYACDSSKLEVVKAIISELLKKRRLYQEELEVAITQFNEVLNEICNTNSLVKIQYSIDKDLSKFKEQINGIVTLKEAFENVNEDYFLKIGNLKKKIEKDKIDFIKQLNQALLYVSSRANKKEKLNFIRYLVELGADINAVDKRGRTALTYVCELGELSIVQHFLKLKADINILDKDGKTVLIQACEGGHLETIRAIVDELSKKNKQQQILNNTSEVLTEDKINIEKQLNQALFSISSKKENHAVIECLIGLGADVNAVDKEGRTALTYVCEAAGELDAVNLLIGDNINKLDDFSRSPITYACEGGKLEIVELLVQSGADIGVGRNNGISVLKYACKGGSLEIVKLITKKLSQKEGLDNLKRQQRALNKNLQNICKKTQLEEVQYFLGQDISDFKEQIKAFKDFESNKVIASCKNLVEEQGKLVEQEIIFMENIIESLDFIRNQDAQKYLEIRAYLREELGRSLLYFCQISQFGNKKYLSYISKLMKYGASLKLVDDLGNNALIYMCKSGFVSILEKMLERPIDDYNINQVNREGKTLLIYACYKGLYNIIELLTNMSSDVLTVSKEEIPLIIACQLQNQNIVRLLLQRGAEVNVQDSRGNTPLSEACKKNNTGIVELLLQYGARADIRDAENNTPLSQVCSNGNISLAKLFLEKGIDIDINSKNAEGETSLLQACANKNLELVKLLLEKGADVNITDNDKNTPLMVACINGDEKIIDLLLKNEHIKLLKKNKFQQTALMIACEYNSSKVVKSLLEKILDVRKQEMFYSESLGFEREGNKAKKAFIREDQNKKPIIKDYMGSDCKEFVDNLKSNGSLDSPDDEGKTPIRRAFENNNLELFKSLLLAGASLDSQGSQSNSLVIDILKKANTEFVELLLSVEFDLEAEDINKKSVLMYMAESFDLGLVQKFFNKLLLQKERSYNTNISNDYLPYPLKNKLEEGSLISECKKGNFKNARKLINESASILREINHKDEKGMTPIMHACQKGSLETVELLLNKGASLTKKDFFNRSAFAHACQGNHIEIVKRLLEKYVLDDEELKNIASLTSNKAIRRLLFARYFIYKKDRQGLSVLDYAVKNRENVTNYFIKTHGFDLKKYASKQKILDKIYKIKDLEIISFLVLKLVNAYKEEDLDYRIHFMHACITGDFKKIQWLFKENTNFQIVKNDRVSQIIVSLAKKSTNSEIIKFLLMRKHTYERDNEGSSALIYSCRKENPLDNIKILVENQYCDVNCQDGTGRTPLMEVCDSEKSNLKAVKYLVEQGADINIRDEAGNTAFMIACRRGHQDVISFLMSLDSKIVATKNNYGQTVFVFALIHSVDTLEFLLQSIFLFKVNITSLDIRKLHFNQFTTLQDLKSQIDLMSQNKKTELDSEQVVFNSVQKDKVLSQREKEKEKEKEKGKGKEIGDHNDKFSKIIKAFKNPNLEEFKQLFSDLDNNLLSMKDEQGKTLLMYASSKKGCLEIVNFLVQKGADIDACDNKGRTSLMYASSQRGCLEIVNFLVQKGADIDACDNKGRTPLIYASSQKGNIETVKFLIESRADINAKSVLGNSALQMASIVGDLDIMNFLISKGIRFKKEKEDLLQEIEDKQKVQNTPPLMEACIKSDFTTVRNLIDEGIDDINQTNNKGETTLMLACIQGDLAIVKNLIEKGADVNIRNSCNQNAFLLACLNNNFEIIRYLIDEKKVSNCDINDSLEHLDSIGSNLEVMKLLVEKGGFLEFKNNEGNTPIMSAINNGRLEAVKLLLDNGVNPNASNKDGISPLKLAYGKGYLDIFRLLFKKTTSVEEISDPNNITTLMTCSLYNKGTEETDKIFFKLLLENNANISAKDIRGETAVTYACKNKKVYIIKILKEELLRRRELVKLKRAELNQYLRGVYEKNSLGTIQSSSSQGVFTFSIDSLKDLDSNKLQDLFTSVKKPDKSLMQFQERLVEKVVSVEESDKALIQFQERLKEQVNQIFHYVCEKGNLEIVQALLETELINGEERLEEFVKRGTGNITIIESLLANGILSGPCDNSLKTMLIYSCQLVDIPAVEYLISKGVNLDHQDDLKKTALIYACSCEYLKDSFLENRHIIVKKLVSAGANIDLIDNEGSTALIEACKAGLSDIAQFLISKNACLDAKDSQGKTALMYACELSEVAIVEALLVKGADIKVKDKNGKGLVETLVAGTRKGAAIGKLLLQNGLDIYSYLDNSETVLSYFESMDIMKDINKLTIEDYHKDKSFLFKQENEALLTLLLMGKENIDLNIIDEQENTMLMHIISAFDNLKLINQLISKLGNISAYINMQNKSKDTALICAIKDEKIAIAKKLISLEGIDIDLKNSLGKTALDEAKERGYDDLVNLLVIKKFKKASEKGIGEIKEFLQEEQVDLTNVKDSEGKSIFRISCEICSLEEVKYLYKNLRIDLKKEGLSCKKDLFKIKTDKNHALITFLSDAQSCSRYSSIQL